MRIRVIGAHNLETRTSRHTCFLIDGVLGVDAGSLASGLTLEEQAALRAIVLTHGHFDHCRDIPTIGLATYGADPPIDLYGLAETLDSVHSRFLDGHTYPDLTQPLNGTPARFALHPIHAGPAFRAGRYQVRALLAEHPAPAVGYIVRSDDGGCVAYTGDTGGSILPFLRDPLAPQVLFVDVTFPDRLRERAAASGHLTPGALGRQLREAAAQGLLLPRVVPVHLGLHHVDELTEALAAVGAEVGSRLVPAHEDMVMEIGQGGD